jgi:hypothetical protein
MVYEADPDIAALEDAHLHALIDEYYDDLAAGRIDPGGEVPLPPLIEPILEAEAAARTVDEIVSRLESLDIESAKLEAERAKLLAAADSHAEIAYGSIVPYSGNEDRMREMAHRSVVAEIATACRQSERTVAARIASAQELVELPSTMAALASGAISARHAFAIVGECIELPEDARPEFEAALLAIAKEQSVARLKRAARRLRERFHPETLAERAAKAQDQRRLAFEAGEDELSCLHLYAPTVDAHQIMTGIDTTARGLLAMPGETRTLDQVRADVATDILLNRPLPTANGGLTSVAAASGKAKTLVMVPVMTLLGLGDEPGMLDGIGPISAASARRLAGESSSFTRVLTHPVSSAILDVDRTQLKVPAALRTYLTVRDETCRFPGCNRRAVYADADHTKARTTGGETAGDNLECLCEPHHYLKHEGGWSVVGNPDGLLTWTSPAGRTYITAPAPRYEQPAVAALGFSPGACDAPRREPPAPEHSEVSPPF